MNNRYDELKERANKIVEVYTSGEYAYGFGDIALNDDETKFIRVEKHHSTHETALVLYEVEQRECDDNEIYGEIIKDYKVLNNIELMKQVYKELTDMGFNSQLIKDKLVLHAEIINLGEFTQLVDKFTSSAQSVEGRIYQHLVDNMDETLETIKNAAEKLGNLTLKLKILSELLCEIDKLGSN